MTPFPEQFCASRKSSRPSAAFSQPSTRSALALILSRFTAARVTRSRGWYDAMYRFTTILASSAGAIEGRAVRALRIAS